MILHCGLLLLFLNCARTTEDVYNYGLIKNSDVGYDRFSFWPSVHNGATLMRLHKRSSQVEQMGQSEGGVIDGSKQLPLPSSPQPSVSPQAEVKNQTKLKPELPKVNTPSNTNETVTTPPVISKNETRTNSTSTLKSTPNQLDLNNPGVLKRGLIVFGGFALLAIAYFIFYRRKNSKNVVNNTHSTIDANQFRYGVLQSEDRRDNLELSRIPLTMESDDDDDEDLEIFDLEQKKKSLSYVNLQTNDEDVVNSRENLRENDRDNLLLDIEDRSSDTLINWSNNGNKSIL